MLRFAFSFAADDTVRNFVREEVKARWWETSGRTFYHLIQVRKTKQVLINTKWVIDEQCEEDVFGGSLFDYVD